MRMLSFQVLLWSLLSLPGWSEELAPAARGELLRAERELRLAEASHRRARQRFEELQVDPGSTPEEVLAMESYVHELSVLVKIRQQTFDDLKAMAGETKPAPDPTVTEGMEAFERTVDSVPSAEEPETEQERLDREFAASLEAYDGMLLAYNRKLEDRIASRSAAGEAAASTQQSAAAEAEELLRSMGVDPGTGEGEQKPGDSGHEVASAGEAPSGGQEESTTAETGTSGSGERRAPREDEDVVARQLREAAEKETDPVLREKLWKEYEAYLDGRS
jgi:hypothetical protein